MKRFVRYDLPYTVGRTMLALYGLLPFILCSNSATSQSPRNKPI